MAAILYTVILLACFFYFGSKNEEPEPYFPLKIIGYLILGSFAFHFNQVSLPLGFIVYLAFFRPKLNVHIKRRVSIFGFFTFILVHWLFPFAIHEWESRPVSIEHNLSSVYSINFQDEYERIRQELALENDSLKLEDFAVEYRKNGNILELHWQLVSSQNEDGYTLYKIEYDTEKKKYRVVQEQLDSWLQYDRLVEADLFFKNLSVLDIQEITKSKGDFPYYVVRSSGERIEYDAKDQADFIVTNGKIEVFDQEQLPVECYYVTAFAMKKTHEEKTEEGNIIEEGYEGAESTFYLFEVNFIEE
ncbi:hypothetical protein A8F94_13725 [Bacillus sp. FJAT-27225]|uniref:hypothetical protein n=1 Tax=Bacillus sp. FJAT-27225 TaxID=1743144 RepID=UPI00080C24DA|nr:hypothetical protein [Bacillus sp. FJAT-27225]OCA85906.1 hypothetical protein A8F94_13725 [Bacillus sp. FJAT-27225]